MKVENSSFYFRTKPKFRYLLNLRQMCTLSVSSKLNELSVIIYELFNQIIILFPYTLYYLLIKPFIKLLWVVTISRKIIINLQTKQNIETGICPCPYPLAISMHKTNPIGPIIVLV